EGHKLSDIPTDDIDQWLHKPGCFVWVALKDASEAELRQMQSEFDLHELALEDALNGHQRPKVEEYGDTLFVVMKMPAVASNPPSSPGPNSLNDEDPWRLGEVAVFVGENFVLSSRRQSEPGFLGVRARCEREPEHLKRGAGFVLYALMDEVVDRYFPLIERLETELEAIEARIFDRGQARSHIERLYILKQRAAVVRHAVAPLLEVAGKLHGGRVPTVCQQSQEYFRDVHDHLVRINTALDGIRETIATAIQVNLSMVTIEESEVTKRLAAWAAIFAVSTALAGIWGMNFEYMPELHWPWGYPMALGIIALSGGVLFWRFRRAGWL
ncbi:MAG: magnesium and cobalt transport protein CorA, partial [Burkholderiales bacterium]|nr:magnesium and cobalt transport protein CorA [Burkholderiales bacterium]